MPISSPIFHNHMISLVRTLAPRTLCDIGPGAGKYGKLARDLDASTHRTCVEIDEKYVEEYKLRDIYNEVIVGDAANMIDNPRVRFDMVIIGDCIEHLRKSSGIDLISFLVYRCGHIIVMFPEAVVQDDHEGHASEAHISVWGPEDFRGLDFVHCRIDYMHLVVIKGYQPTKTTIRELHSDAIVFA